MKKYPPDKSVKAWRYACHLEGVLLSPEQQTRIGPVTAASCAAKEHDAPDPACVCGIHGCTNLQDFAPYLGGLKEKIRRQNRRDAHGPSSWFWHPDDPRHDPRYHHAHRGIVVMSVLIAPPVLAASPSYLDVDPRTTVRGSSATIETVYVDHPKHADLIRREYSTYGRCPFDIKTTTVPLEEFARMHGAGKPKRPRKSGKVA